MNKKGKMFSTWMGISPQSNGWQAVENVRVPNCAIVVGVIEAQKTRYLLLNLNLKKNDPSRNKSRFYHVKKKQRALYFVYAARVDCQSLISIFGEFIFKKQSSSNARMKTRKETRRVTQDAWKIIDLPYTIPSVRPNLIWFWQIVRNVRCITKAFNGGHRWNENLKRIEPVKMLCL